MAEEKTKEQTEALSETTEEEAVREDVPAKSAKEGAGLRFKTSKGVCRICRRSGEKLFLKGDRCATAKCSFTRRSYAPGQHGPNRQPRYSEYGRQLREKQKLAAMYGLKEKNLQRYFNISSKRKGKTGETLLQTLERRLDNVIYRAGFARSRKHARQIVNHNNVSIRENRVNIPSYLVSEKESIKVKNKRQDKKKTDNKAEMPKWMKIDNKNKSIKILRLPTRDDLDLKIDEQLIVEFYSK